MLSRRCLFSFVLLSLVASLQSQTVESSDSTKSKAAGVSGLASAPISIGGLGRQSPGLKLNAEIVPYCEARAATSEHPAALANVCEFALSMRKKLPDVTCDREMRRYWRVPGIRVGFFRHEDEDHEDVATAKVIYRDGQEFYNDLRINGKPVDTSAAALPGTWSNGEFATILQEIFLQPRAEFKFKKEEVLHSTPVLVFQFHVEQKDNKSYFLQSGDRTWFPDYHGQLWIEKTTFHLLRLERETAYMPKYPITRIKTEIEYSNILLGDGSKFVLPAKSDVLTCPLSDTENTGKCSHNIIKFTNWHIFVAKTQILMNAAH
jgi:hypothetical protein